MTNVYAPFRLFGLQIRSHFVLQAAILVITAVFCVSGPAGMAMAQDDAMDEFGDIAGPGEDPAAGGDAAADAGGGAAGAAAGGAAPAEPTVDNTMSKM